ncbi:hypothetical protein pb186bvf_017652 [Paramecium bursaria]
MDSGFYFNDMQYIDDDEIFLDDIQKQAATEQEDKRVRIQRNIEKRKQKLKSDNSSSQTLSKEEIRKQRNRNSAQLSRDRKKIIFESLQQENQELKIQLEQKENDIRKILEDKNRIALRLEYLEENSYKCILCQQDMPPTLQRQTVISKNNMATFGLLTLFAMISICAVSVQNTPGLTYLSQMQIQEPIYSNSTSIDFFHKDLVIPSPSPTFNSTLFINCTETHEGGCDNIMSIVKARNADNVFYVSDPEIGRNKSSYPVVGDEVFLLRVKQEEDDSWQIFRAVCSVRESAEILIEQLPY